MAIIHFVLKIFLILSPFVAAASETSLEFSPQAKDSCYLQVADEEMGPREGEQPVLGHRATKDRGRI